MIYCYFYTAQEVGEAYICLSGYYESNSPIDSSEKLNALRDEIQRGKHNAMLVSLSLIATKDEGVDAPPASS